MSLVSVLSDVGRSALTAAGSAIGALAAVAAVGLSLTSASQVDGLFDELAQSQVVVRPTDAQRTADLPRELVTRTPRWHGVDNATLLTRVQSPARAVAPPLHTARQGSTPVLAVDNSALRTLEVAGLKGRWLPEDPGAPFAVIGTAVSSDLGVTAPFHGQAIEVGGHLVEVVGTFETSPREPSLATHVLVSKEWAENRGLDAGTDRALLTTRLGAAPAVAAHLATITEAVAPGGYAVSSPPTIENLRSRVTADVDVLTLAVSIGAVLVGGLGIANASLIGIARRRGEFALRRALGATTADVGLQVLMEGALLGALGAVAGASAGVITVVAVSALQGWQPILDVGTVAWTVAGSSAVGAVASIWPALRASRVQPAEAIRQL